MRTGWTSESCPKCSAIAWSRNEKIIRTNPQQPDATSQRMRHETEGQRGISGCVFYPHALEDAGERIGYCGTQGADEDHGSLVFLDRSGVGSRVNSLYSTRKSPHED